MAGEMILPLSNKGVVSVEVVLTADTERGDYVQLDDAPGFALAAGKKDETIAVCIACDLVSIPVKSNPKLSAGWKVIYDTATQQVKRARKADTAEKICGVVHDALTANASPALIVWRGGMGKR